MVKGRLELQSQNNFKVKSDKLEFEMKYELATITDVRADYRMCGNDDHEDTSRIKAEIKDRIKEKESLYKEWNETNK